MKKQRALRTCGECFALAMLYPLFVWLPLFLSRALAFIMADVWRFFDRRHVERVMKNSMDRLGIDAAAAANLARDNYRHYVLTVLEILRLWRLPVERIDGHVANMNILSEHTRAGIAAGRGLVFVTGHLGNWEWAALVAGLQGVADGMVARPLDNPVVDAVMRRIREKSGVTLWSKFGVTRSVLKTLKRGRAAGVVLDQDGGPNGFHAPFLGRDCTNVTMPIEAAMRSGAPICAGAVLRDGYPMCFRVEVRPLHWPNADADPEEEKLRLVTAVNDDLSDIVRKHPEQWQWIHNRWRNSLDGA